MGRLTYHPSPKRQTYLPLILGHPCQLVKQKIPPESLGWAALHHLLPNLHHHLRAQVRQPRRHYLILPLLRHPQALLHSITVRTKQELMRAVEDLIPVLALAAITTLGLETDRVTPETLILDVPLTGIEVTVAQNIEKDAEVEKEAEAEKEILAGGPGPGAGGEAPQIIAIVPGKESSAQDPQLGCPLV